MLFPAGTLTVQGLELQSIVPVNNGRFEPSSTDMQQLPPAVPQLLASCHGLAWLGDTLVGDPLDQKLFAASGWTLIDKQAADSTEPAAAIGSEQQCALVHPPSRPDSAASIVRRFEFSSQLQRNLVVVKPAQQAVSTIAAATSYAVAAPADVHAAGDTADLLGSTLSGPLLMEQPSWAPTPTVLAGAAAAATHLFYAKGSPEMIKTLVQPSSVPPDFDRVLSEYTKEGLRVLALACGCVSAGSLPEGALATYSQQQLEAAVPLELVGLAVLANPLRPDTAGAIQALQKAQVGLA